MQERTRFARRAAALTVLLAVCLLLSIGCGSQWYSPAQLWQAVRSADTRDPVYRILFFVRLPRTAAALLAGSALGVAGALIQSVLNNAMASPNVIGVNAGAGLGALLAASLLPGAAALLPGAAFTGALAAALFIWMLAAMAGLSRTTLILAGVTVSSILTACMNTLKLLFPDAAVGSAAFLLGTLSGVTAAQLQRALPWLAAGFVLAALLAADLNVLQLGEDMAAGLGLAVGRVRFAALLTAALLAGAAVSFAGLVGFVGLLAPHIARRLAGGDNRRLLPMTALASADLMLLCDVAARVLFAPFELPVGVLLSLVGGPFFLFLLLRRKRSRLYD